MFVVWRNRQNIDTKKSITLMPLITTLNDEWRIVREAAIVALSQLRRRRAVEPLIAFLEDKDVCARRKAIEALGKIGDARAIRPLTAAAIQTEDIVDQHKIRDWTNNPDTHRKIKFALDEYLYDVLAEQQVHLSNAELDMLLENLVELARRRDMD